MDSEEIQLQLPNSASDEGGEDTVHVTENQKRWSVVGLCLNSVLLPTLRTYIEPVLSTFFNELQSKHNIDTQEYPNYLENYGKVYLNYQRVNNNKMRDKDNRKYDYKIKNAIDLSKLFLNTTMTEYDDYNGCDLSSILWIIKKTGRFSGIVESYAVEVRNVRNTVCHDSDFSKWDEETFKSAFNLLKELVKSLNQHNNDEILSPIGKKRVKYAIKYIFRFTNQKGR